MTGKSEKQIRYAEDMIAWFMTDANEAIRLNSSRVERWENKDAERYADKIRMARNRLTAWSVSVERLNKMDDAGEILDALTGPLGLRSAARAIESLLNEGHTVESAISQVNSGEELVSIRF